jgi:hypothetical protein
VTRSRGLTPEEQILSLFSAVGNSAVADLLGGAAPGVADAKGGATEADAKYADAKGETYTDEKSDAGADAKAATEPDAKYADAKGETYTDEKSDADAKAGSESADSKTQEAPSTFQIDWLYELRTRKPRS